jgi:hypothetical protein
MRAVFKQKCTKAHPFLISLDVNQSSGLLRPSVLDKTGVNGTWGREPEERPLFSACQSWGEGNGERTFAWMRDAYIYTRKLLQLMVLSGVMYTVLSRSTYKGA